MSGAGDFRPIEPLCPPVHRRFAPEGVLLLSCQAEKGWRRYPVFDIAM
jgi:hypothetical protein